ncbi:MAG TPA: porin [Hyphomonadaceae bacterium]|nr:porin [Hyphomonadaceae bacterium]
MQRSLTLTFIAFAVSPAAFAQEYTVDARLTIAGANIADESALALAGDDFLASGRLVVTRKDVLDSGLQLTWRGDARLERDTSPRPSFAGVIGSCPPSNVTCPRVPSGPIYGSPVSPATGIASDGPIADEDLFLAVDSASLTISGAWGETVLGFDSGAASMLDARPPTVLQRVSAFSPGLDPSGLVVTRARNDVTGPSAKVSYLSPRWLGVRLGGSFTPTADMRGSDFDPGFDALGLAKADLENVWEGAASFERQFASWDINVRAALTYSHASSSSGFQGFGDYDAVGAGIEVEKDDWTGGLRWLSSNNAWESGNGDYEAIEASLVRRMGDWRIGAELGNSTDDLNGVEGTSWLVGATYTLMKNVDLGGALVSSVANVPVLLPSGSGHTEASNEGLVIELTVRN